MSYYIATEVKDSFANAVEKTTAALAAEGFGVLTQIDVQATMKKKLNVEFPPYVILGSCNPPFAYRALTAEDKIGTMLPCNVIVHETESGVEVAAVDPLSSMQAVENPALEGIAHDVKEKLRRVIESLK